MLIAIAFIAFFAMIASWLFTPETRRETTPSIESLVPAPSAAD